MGTFILNSFGGRAKHIFVVATAILGFALASTPVFADTDMFSFGYTISSAGVITAPFPDPAPWDSIKGSWFVCSGVYGSGCGSPLMAGTIAKSTDGFHTLSSVFGSQHMGNNWGDFCAAFGESPCTTSGPSIATDGNYFLEFVASTTSTTYGYPAIAYMNLNRSGGVWAYSPPFSSTQSFIQSLIPENGSTTASSFSIQSTVYNADDGYSGINFILQNLEAPLESTASTSQFSGFIPFVASGFNNLSTSTPSLLYGRYLLTVSLVGSSSVPTSLVAQKSSQFTVVRSSLPSNIDTPDFASTTAPGGVLTACNSTSSPTIIEGIGCTLQNIFVQTTQFLFYPSSVAVSQYSQLPQQLSMKIPFVYLFNVQQIVASSTASASTSTIATFTYTTATSSPFHFSVVLFSPALLQEYINGTLAVLIKTLLTAAVLLEMLWYIWNRIRHLIQVKA